ncbi:hypothetical protein H3302_17920 [Pseudoalteromonas sp. MT33b]|uniref:hypothetical protein n=1 Tax=Pseudoalteromonas sp. MT33b TaxID=2759705 RepID=UPI0015FB4AC9|nr:hypothetical protein [Pseudoalteromonas sp. MT33b]QMW16858.1 hypothetical protein H3302_17920 [Pseudoalteromonas sp. MT33b]
MVIRNLVRCNSCKETQWLRIDRPELKKDTYLYSCPTCSTEIFIDTKKTSKGISIESDECETIDFDEYHNQNLPTGIVTLSSHYPIFTDVHHKELLEGGSPKLYYFSRDIRGAKKYDDVITFFSLIKEHMYGEHSRVLNALESGNLSLVRELLSASKFEANSDILKANNAQLIYEVYSYLSVIFFTSLEIDDRQKVYSEYYDELNNCIDKSLVKYSGLLMDLHHKHEYLENRSKLFNLHKRLFRQIESYMAGFIYEYASDDFKNDIDKCRLYRADFDTVKSLYVDIFELISKTSTYIVLIANLSKRGDINLFSDGSMSVSKFKKLTSFKKLQFLSELPLVSSLFQSVSRKMRNEIGHFSARYDVKSGNVIFDSGKTENYLIFLNNLLQAIKALKIVYTIYSKVDLDMEQYKSLTNE